MMKEHGDSWITVVLRAAVAALAALAATWDAATTAGLAAAAFGAVAGVLGGEALGRTRVRLALPAAVAAALAGLGVLASWALARWDVVAAAAGPSATIVAGDAVLLFGLAGGLCLALRATGARWRPAAALEIAAFATALASPLAAHRGGSINRPLDLGDHALAAGEDPVIYLQLAGGVAAVGLALFLITEKRWVRAFAAAVLVLLVAAVMGLVGTMIQPPQPRTDDGLGLTGQGQGERGRGEGKRSLDQMDFRDNYGSKSRSAPVAVVLLHQDYEPPSGVYYFRQNAFSRYNGRRMVPAIVSGAEADVFEVFPSQAQTARWVPPPTNRVEVETTVAFIQDHVAPVVLESPRSLTPAKNPAPRRFRRVYEATSLALDVDPLVLVGSKVGDPSWSPVVHEIYTEAPTDARYLALATKIVEALPPELADDPVARAAVITSYLSERGTYSLRSRHANAPDPTASFLFGDLTGYCVYFAHAAVFLIRSLGIPARVATGYAYPAEERGRGSALMLRGGDAHAWPEVFVEGTGWVVMDVTPARNLEPPGSPLDADLQRLLGEMLRGQLEQQRQATVALGRSPVGLRDLLRAAGAVARGAGVVVLVLIVLLYLGKTVRRLAPLAAGEARRTRLEYRAALDVLAEVGHRRRYGEPPESFAARVTTVAPSLAALAAAAVARKLGSRRPDDTAASARLRRSVVAEVRRAVPWWRRAIGVLDPLSWLRVR
jgi:transglutaminase-like putative cysteine protease